MGSARPSDPFLLLCALLVDLEAEAGSADDRAVLQARIDLYRHLVDEGWQPPDRIRSLLHLNDLVLALDVEQWLAGAAEREPQARQEPQEPLARRPSSADPSRDAPPRRPSPGEPRLGDAADESALVAAYSRGPLVDVREVDPVAARLVFEAERDLRLVAHPQDATRRLVALVRALGGDLASGDEQDGQDADLLPLDLSFAAGPPLLVRAEALSLARLRLERHLPGLVELARRALADRAP